MKNIIKFFILICVVFQSASFAQKVAGAEFFWDTDPGVGNGTAFVAADGSFNGVLETALNSNITIPSVGVHTFNVRVKGFGNKWGPVFSVVIDVLSSVPQSLRTIKVTAGEYFWDTDPGKGNGTALVALDGAYNQAIETAANSSISLPGLGVHKFTVRLKDGEGSWGPGFSTVIRIDTTVVVGKRNIKVTAGECYWNSDPGQGNGTPLIAFDGNFDGAMETVSGTLLTGSLSLGPNVLHTRVKSADGTWGPSFGVVVRIDTYQSPVVKIFGSTNALCAGGNTSGITYYVDSVAGYTYKWSVTGGSIAASSTKPAVSVNWNAVGPYALKVVECNSFDCDSSTIPITVTPIPTTPVVTNNGPACVGSSVALSTPAVAGATYSWTGPNNYSSNQQNPSLSVAAQNMTGTYSLVVTVSGCASAAGITSVKVSPVPTTPVITTSTPLCEGDSLLLTTAAVTNATYSWLGPNSFSSATQNAKLLNVTLAASGTYSLSVSVDGCSSPNSTAAVVVNAKPTTPTVTQAGKNLVSNFSIGNQWYLNGNPIAGATSNTYTPTQTGTYIASITNVNGCTAKSAPFTFTFVGISNGDDLANTISVYPNPAKGSFTISLSAEKPTTTVIQLINLLGAVLYEQEINYAGRYSKTINADYPAGIYFIRFQAGATQFVQKLVIE